MQSVVYTHFDVYGMAYKGRLVEFVKKLGIKTIKILKKIRDASSLWDNKGGNTQGMCFWGKK